MASSNPTVWSAGRFREFVQLDVLTVAPSVTTSRLYNLNGVLYFDGVNLETGGGSGGGSLNEAYENGSTITLDTGAIIFNDATTGAANSLEFNKTGAGSGNILDFDFSAAFTGNVLNIDFGSAVAAVGIVFDAEGGARTGADLLFTSDGSEAHSLLDINQSGSGASIAFDWTGSYNGNGGGQIFKLTFDANDNLTTEVEQIDTGAGERGIMFDYNFGHTDAGTTSHIWDIDVSGILDSNIFDFATSAACTGNVFFLNLDNGVAMTGFHVEGSGVRTQPMIELATDATGSADLVTFVVTGAISGNVLDFAMDTTSTGNVIDVDMNAAVGAKAIYLDSGAGTRTASLIDILADGNGNSDVFNIDRSNTGSAIVFDINVSGIGSGNVFDITYSAADTGNAINIVMADNVAGAALNVTAAGVRTDNLIEVTTSETGSVDGIVRVDATGIFTGSVVTLKSSGAATTGSLLHLDLDAGVAYKAITFDHAGAREVASVLVSFDGTFASGGGGTFLDADITMTGAAASPFIDVDVTGVYTGNIIDVLLGAVLATGDVIKIDLGATATGSQAIVLASGAMARSTALVSVTDAGTDSGGIIFDINSTGARAAVIFDIDDTGITTGNVFDYATNSASTGTIFEINLTNAVAAKLGNYTLAGTRTANAFTVTDSSAGAVDTFQIDNSGTSSGHIFDINVSGNSTGNVLDIVYSASAVAGDAIHIDMGTNLAGNAVQIDAAGVRTAPLINIVNTGTDAGTDDHVILISQTGVLNSDVINITYSSGASDGNALFIAMGTNVAGSAVQITSAATGTSGEGALFDATHTGDLVAGANLVDIISTGSPSSTSHVMSLQQTTGAGNVGSYVLYLNATGTNVEALKVDAGNVVFDENLTVSGKVIFDGTETIAGGGTSTALNLAKTLHHIDADAGGDTFTLADGVTGQIMYITMESSTGTATITPANLAGGTSITFNAAGDSVCLLFQDAEWYIIGGNSYAVV